MVIVMEKSATPEQVRRVEEKLKDRGFSTHLSQGVERTIIGAIGDRDAALMESLATLSGVERVVRNNFV